MDTGVANGIYTSAGPGLFSGAEAGVSPGLANGALNEVLLQNGIVRSGLILNYDAGSRVSYPGSGTSIYDLNGGGNNATLNGSCSFNSTKNGFINYDGGYASFNVVANTKSVSSWVNFKDATNFNIYSNVGESFYINGVKSDLYIGNDYVTNGDFNSNTSSWSTQGGSISWQNDIGGDGSVGYLRFNVASNTSYDRFSQNVGLVASTAYYLSFWYRASAGITGGMIAILNSNPNTLSNQVYAAYPQIYTTWSKLNTFFITTSTDGFPNISFTKPGNIGSGTWDYDAIKIRKINIPLNSWINFTTTSSTPMPYAYRLAQAPSGSCKCNIANALFYDRELTANEVMQNYIATKQRFGL